MAKVTLKDGDVPQIPMPVGSLKEVQALGIPTRNIATCSQHTDTNRGCLMYDNCDRDFRDTRPQNQLCEIVSPEGDVRTVPHACFTAVRAELDCMDNGGLVTIVGGEGTEYVTRGSVKKHVTRDPDCNDCAQGKCFAYVDVDDIPHIVPAFPSAIEHPELKKFARKTLAKAQQSLNKRAAVREKLLAAHPDLEVGRAVSRGASPKS